MGGGTFGVRRPLRFLSHKLELDEKQTGKLARILDELKTERAQAAVDERRTTGTLADVVAADPFDQKAALAAAHERVESARRVQDAVVQALSQIHAMLDPEQREHLAYLIRSGWLGI